MGWLPVFGRRLLPRRRVPPVVREKDALGDASARRLVHIFTSRFRGNAPVCCMRCARGGLLLPVGQGGGQAAMKTAKAPHWADAPAMTSSCDRAPGHPAATHSSCAARAASISASSRASEEARRSTARSRRSSASRTMAAASPPRWMTSYGSAGSGCWCGRTLIGSTVPDIDPAGRTARCDARDTVQLEGAETYPPTDRRT